MLLQSIFGIDDEIIIEDYYKSNKEMNNNVGDGSAAIDNASTTTTAATRRTAKALQRKRGQLDWNIFSGTNQQAMIDTLQYLRIKYGSVNPGYLDSIGFDIIWRERMLRVLRRTGSTSTSLSSISRTSLTTPLRPTSRL